MEKKKNKFLHFLINIGTSGKYTERSQFGLSDYLIRYVLMNFIIISGIGTLAMFTVVNLGRGLYFTSLVCAGMVVADIIAFVLARTRIRQIIPAFIIAICYALMCVLITWTGEAEGANFLFIYIYPSLAIILLGMSYGVTLSVIIGALISIEMFVPNILLFNYHFDFSIRMLVNYILVLLIMIVIESTRKTKDRIVEAQRLTLQEQTTELQASNENLQKMTNQLFFANEKLNDLSTTDELTKLHNRRSLMEYMDIIWKQCRRLHLPVSVLMIDIDYFKKYNDTLGHLEGDKALVAIAQCLRNFLKRETDFVARFGGEEFVCLLPYIEKADAVDFAEKLVQNVENMKIPHPKSEHSKFVTISAGVARVLPAETNSHFQLLDEADKALYDAKQAGRNRVASN